MIGPILVWSAYLGQFDLQHKFVFVGNIKNYVENTFIDKNMHTLWKNYSNSTIDNWNIKF